MKRSYLPIDVPEPLPYSPRRGILTGLEARGLDNSELTDVNNFGKEMFSRLEKRLSPSDISTFASGLLQCPDSTDCNGPGAVEDGAGGSEDACPVGGASKERRAPPNCPNPGAGGQATCTDTKPRLMCKKPKPQNLPWIILTPSRQLCVHV